MSLYIPFGFMKKMGLGKEPTPGPFCCYPGTVSDFSGNVGSFVGNIGLLNDGNIIVQGLQLGTYSGSSISNSIVIDKCGVLVKNITPSLIDGNFAGYTQQSNNNLIIRTSYVIVGFDSSYNYNSSFYSGACQPNTSQRLYGISTIDSDKILAVGNFNNYQVTGGTIYSGFTNIIMLNSNGVPDTTYQPVLSPNTGGQTMYKDTNGKIVIGNVTSFSGITTYGLVRLNGDGTYDNTFSGQTSSFSGINAIQQQSNGQYLIGGAFENYSGLTTQKYLIRLNYDGSLDTSFNYQEPSVPDQDPYLAFIYDIYVLPNDKILVSDAYGIFTRYNSNGSIDNTFYSGFTSDSYYSNFNENTITVDTEGSIWLGGSFQAYNGYNVGKLVKLYSNGILNQCTTPLITPTPTPTPTATPTGTPTGTPTPTPTNSIFYEIVFYGTTTDEACLSPISNFPMTGNGTTFCNSTTFTNAAWNTVATGNYVLEFSGNIRNVSHTFGQGYATTYDAGCGNCPTPTPTPTPTNTPTPSPTPSSASITYQTFVSNTASQTTYTFTGVTIGGSGLIAVSVHSEASTARTISSATINGNAATIVSQITQGAGQSTNTGIIYLRVTSGTTANISITFTGAVLRCGIGVWRIQNNISDTPLQSQTAGANSGTGLTITFTGLTSNNAGVCSQTNGSDNTPLTWTNATENYDVATGSGQTQMSGGNFLTTSSGNRVVSTSHSNSSQPLTLVGVVWN